ncbi:MAG: Hsp70 family protein [Desulfuromonadaceae bacterium]|nr:Hsp70 family protein [Desulfuromonas sp.]MDY0185383.1 Hsp70 family protein [Desulfuromonadaceae bacterium]
MSESKIKYAIGIDLGTSNSALSIAALASDEPARSVNITQVTSRKGIGTSNVLPSCIYLATEQEQKLLPQIPWQQDQSLRIGMFAREHGAEIPERLVTSAKSWLCNPHNDPYQSILPWQSSLEERKLSPIKAQTLYLEYLRHNLEQHLRQEGTELDLTQCQVTLTVPASFDEVARLLTAEAAQQAGWGEVTLLEEQQAAFYHWLDCNAETWREQVSAGDVILVCDIGGGTADFSLIAVTAKDAQLHLERISVGDHLLLGGDNMDLALAYTLRAELEDNGKELDNAQFLALIHACRQGKEALLADPNLHSYPIAVAGRGASLFARSRSTQLQREHIQNIVLDGFLPLCAIDSMPEENAAGLQEVGLNYTADPVISKHLARFLVNSGSNLDPEIKGGAELQRCHTHSHSSPTPFIFPSAILFNGGIFKADPVRERILALIQGFCPDRPLRQLSNETPELAVARGAAGYGRIVARGTGIRIKAGTARSYYLGLQSSMPAVPGLKPRLKGVCIVPQGMEEGTEYLLEGREFGLMTGQVAEFRFFSSSARSGDEMGTEVMSVAELDETARLEVTLEAEERQRLPVQLLSRITELGTLELWMEHQPSGGRWKIEFNLRAQE